MAKSKQATLQSIADDLGLHVSTVARVLNGMREGERAASGATAERIRQRAAEVNYRPNPHAASLRTKRTNLVGVLVPRLSDVVLATVYEGIESAAAERGLTAFVANTQDDPADQRKRIEMMLDRRVDGLILGDARADDHTVLEELARREVPFVLVNRSVAGYPAATCDNYLGGRLAAEHLLELGTAASASSPASRTPVPASTGRQASSTASGKPGWRCPRRTSFSRGWTVTVGTSPRTAYSMGRHHRLRCSR